MYQSAIKHIPVHWIISIFDVINFVVDMIHGIVNRTCSFVMANFWNLSGLDAYYVFLDDNPSAIPYPKFMLGGVYERKWYYNMRNHEFTYGDYRTTARIYLPAIMGTYKHVSDNGNETVYDITEFMNKLRFKSFPHIFPTPAQMLNAWSLHSGIWLSLCDGTHTLTVMNGTTGEDIMIPLTYGNRFPWTVLENDDSSSSEEEGSSSEEESSSSEEESSSSEEESSSSEEESSSSEEESSSSEEDAPTIDPDLQVIAPMDVPTIPN